MKTELEEGRVRNTPEDFHITFEQMLPKALLDDMGVSRDRDVLLCVVRICDALGSVAPQDIYLSEHPEEIR